jgi:F-type H+-transporting ATPase subunit b
MPFTFTLAAASAEGASSGISALGINAGAFISQLISFIIVLVILKIYVLPVIQRTLDKRQALIREGVENAERARRDLEEATARAEQIILDAQHEANARLDRATKSAEQIAHQIEAAARERGEKIFEQQIARIQQEANRARMELSREVVNLSIDAATRVISRSVDNKDNRRLIEEFVTTSDQSRNN